MAAAHLAAMFNSILADAPDELLTPAQIAALCPRRRAGRKTAVQTIYRWFSVGCKGVKLPYVQLGGTRCVTRRALAEFFQELTDAENGGRRDGAPTPAPATRSLAARQRASDAAEKALIAAGA